MSRRKRRRREYNPNHRWVLEEPDIPFDLPVIYEDDAIIVVDKPHFLSTMPRGMWYRQTALIRLRERYDDPMITPAHRLDRATAGIVVFVRDPELRGKYQLLFEHRKVHKTYECVAPARPIQRPRTGIIRMPHHPQIFPLERESHIIKIKGEFCAREIPGSINARTRITRKELRPGISAQYHEPMCRYFLEPITGKTHQLRIHMNSLGMPIAGDELYPRMQQRPFDDFSTPLQLVARTLQFTDPVTGEDRFFESQVPLAS